MQNLDELDRAIRDRQVRYRHEAYRGRSRSHPAREWLGDRLVTLGEAMRGQPRDSSVPPAERLPHGHPA